MANSIVTLLEIFFPQSIEKLKKEKSNIDGPKPLIFEDSDVELLFYFLTEGIQLVNQEKSKS